MPRITEFTSPVDSFRPSETGIEATAQSARRISGIFGGVAEMTKEEGARIGGAIASVGKVAVDYATHQDKAELSVKRAQTFGDLEQQWEDAKKANPNDPNLAANFRQTVVEPALEKLGEGAFTEGGQNYAQASVDALRQHFTAKTAADSMSMAKDRIDTQLRQIANSYSVAVHSDPTSIDAALDGIDHSVGEMVGSMPNLGGESSKVRNELTQKYKEEIVKSAAIGYIEKTATMPPWASNPKYAKYLNGVELKQFESYAKSQQRQNMMTDKALRDYQVKEETLAAKKERSQVFTNNVSFDENGNETIKPGFYKQMMDVERKYPGRITEEIKTSINWAQAQQRERREVINDDPDTVKQLYDGLFNVDKPTTQTDILSAAAQKKLSPHTQSTLIALEKSLSEEPLKGPIWHDTMTAVKDALVVNIPGIPGKDNIGIANYAKFVQNFVPAYLAQRRAGTLPPNALDVNDPKSMISQAMAPFKRSQADRMRDFIAGAGGAVAGTTAPTITLPPKNERKSGDVYPTPRGPLRWDGATETWVKP